MKPSESIRKNDRLQNCSSRLMRQAGICCFSVAIMAFGQSKPAVPHFAVAAVKPCRADAQANTRSGGISSPGLLEIDCQTLKSLVQIAYISFATGQRVTPNRIPIEGGPSWISAERYEIKARAENAENPVMMHGPMLQALLEERFHLKIHRETRKIPVYALTAAKGGPKIRPLKEGSCNPYDLTASFPPPPAPENPCVVRGGMNDGLLTLTLQATTLDDFARFQLRGLDRPVIDRTGLKGLFEIHLEFTPDEAWLAQIRGQEAPPAASSSSGPSIFTAVQEQLGLKLEPTTGPGEYVVIDSVDKPSEN